MSELEHTNTGTELVTVIDGVAVTTTLSVAHGTGVEHSSVIRLVRDYQADFEEFGVVGFEIRKITAGPGRPETYAVLNEDQATLLLTYMRNSVVVRDFKKRLVWAFRELRLRSGDPGEPSDARELALQTQLLARRADALASALIATQDALDLEKRDHRDTREYVQLMEPVAESWLALADAQGTFSVADTSAILNNDHGIDIGEIRLFRFMEQQGWIYRTNGPKSPWRPYQAQITAGRLGEKIGERYYDRASGQYRLGTPSVRVTIKGLHRLRIMLTGGGVRTRRSPALPPAPDPR